MQRNVAKQAIDYFINLGAGADDLEIILTGGEPLLAESTFSFVLEYATDRAASAEMKPCFVLKTNGMLLDNCTIQTLREYAVKTVISIDGRPESHNSQRRSLDGLETHATVRENILGLLKAEVSCVASMTIVPQNADQILENILYLRDLGIDKIDIGPAYGTVAWTKRDSVTLSDSFIKIAEYIRAETASGRTLEIGPLYRDSEHQNGALSDTWGCHAAQSNLAFLPDGGIAGCSALAMLTPQMPKMLIGNVSSGIDEIALASLLELTGGTIENRPACKQCLGALNCTGGCLAMNLAQNGEANQPPEFYCKCMLIIPEAIHKAWD